MKSKDYLLYLSHHGLTSLIKQNVFKFDFPKLSELLQGSWKSEPVSVAKEWDDP